jgi:hypothetical protein
MASSLLHRDVKVIIDKLAGRSIGEHRGRRLSRDKQFVDGSGGHGVLCRSCEAEIHCYQRVSLQSGSRKVLGGRTSCIRSSSTSEQIEFGATS